ncbi:hypothetical protein GGX14DRAFT_619248 [Mycena pura]|uniref:HMG box domain-containing protein n=1 Tax=Mycena pura TaxID=153505 RepID=A0AAD6YHD7_9AGAR|nr:hypothetical protein GGX14DRAFT_619248 [Mycena pura]
MPALRTRDTHSPARHLQVNTAPPPPALAIISPTPRAFTFPLAHNLADSPFSSPSNSPFEPDLSVLALSAASTPISSVSGSSRNHEDDDCRSPPPPPLPLSAYTRTLSPAPTPGAAAASPPAQPTRRKSTGGNPDERRPKKGDEDYVKRPENAFILFRRQCCADRAALGASSPDSAALSSSAPASLVDAPNSADSAALGKKARQADLSKTISAQWRALPAEERAKWEELARERKKEHAERHPGYVYRPQRRAAAQATLGSPSPSAFKRRKGSVDPSEPGTSVEFVVPSARSPHGRSASMPPYQAIQIPNVYLGAGVPPASPDEPSLLPMIANSARKTSHSAGFDYLPTFGAALDFEASLQASDFLRAMFPPYGNALSPTDTGAGAHSHSPASSPSGSGPSSPYTPAATSTGFAPQYAPQQHGHAHAAPSPGSLLEAAYSSADGAGAWGSNPWARLDGSVPPAGLAPGDFDLAGIPEIGWALGDCAFPAASPGGGDEGHAHGYMGLGMDGGEKGYDGGMGLDLGLTGEMGIDMMGMDMSEMEMGDMGMGMGFGGEMGFDGLLAGNGF